MRTIVWGNRRTLAWSAWGGALLGALAITAGPAACTSSSNGGPANGDGGSGSPDSTIIAGDDGGQTNADGGPNPNANCSDAATGPLGLTCADFPGDDPCPNQAILTDATKFAALKAAMTSGVLLHADVPFNASDANIYKEKCGLEGYWDPAKATALVPPSSSIPELGQLFAPSSDGNAGICASYTGQGGTTDGFPAAGNYRIQFHAAYQGETYVVRARATVSGTAAGQSFVAAGLSDGGFSTSTAGIANALAYEVNGTVASEATLWTTLVAAFSSSSTSFPSATISAQTSAGGPVVWTATVDLLCASSKSAPAAGAGVVTVSQTIPVAGSPGAIGFNTGLKRAYVAMTTLSDAGIDEPAGIAVIDDTTNAVVATITTTNGVTTIGSNDTTSLVYASEQQSIDVIGSANTITTSVNMPSGYAEGFAVDETNNVIYVLGDTAIYALSGANNTFGASPIAFTGMTVPTADFTGGKPSLAFDSTTSTLYAIGLDGSLNGVIKTFNAGTGALLNTYSLATGYQPTAIAAFAGGAAATVVNTSGTYGVLLVGQTTPTTTATIPESITRCGTTVAVVGADSTGLASFATFAPASGSLGAATVFDASELQENGAVPYEIVNAGTSGGGCAFYGSYTYNANALYAGGSNHVPPPPSFVVKLTND